MYVFRISSHTFTNSKYFLEFQKMTSRMKLAVLLSRLLPYKHHRSIDD